MRIKNIMILILWETPVGGEGGGVSEYEEALHSLLTTP